MEGLSFENIYGASEIDTLFAEPVETKENNGDDGSQKSNDNPDNPEKHDDTETKTTEAVNPEDLFEGDAEEQPESVGSEKKVKEQGDATTEEDSGTSPNENFYYSIANALAVDGIFPNLDDETIKNANDAESFSKLIEDEVQARLDETQQRVAKALNNGVEADDIRKYEGALQFLASIKETAITAETPEGEQLRYRLIYQDFLNKGMSPEKADKFTRRSMDNGNDIDDAKEALQSNKEYFQTQYQTLLNDAEKAAEVDRADRQKKAEKLRESMLKDKDLLGDMELSNDIRKKAYDTITRPVYKDPETGEYLTALQKYQEEHPADFLKYVGLVMTLTNDFKDWDSFVKGKVKKEMRKGVSELERVLKGSSRNPDGSLKMVTSVKDDPESYFAAGNIKLAL